MIKDPVLINDWHPVAATSQLSSQPILSIRLLGEDIVLWKSGNHYMAWQDLCIHRGSKLSGGKIVGDDLQCPYHGWTYNNEGLCVKIPAHPEQKPPTKAKVKTYLVKEKYDMLWVCLGEPANDVPQFPEWEQNGYTWAVCDPIKNVPAHGPRIIENFLDAAHFPFVHEGVLGDQAHPEMEDFEARISANGVESDAVYIYQPAQYGTTGGGKVSYIYRAFRPFTAHMTKHVPAGWWGKDAPSATHGLMLTLTPHDELDTTVWFLISSTMWTDPEVLQREYTKRITDIFEEDRAIVVYQRPELLPLDLQAELHLKSDRVAIAYRSWLKQLGLKFGTA
jgi:phenylpropionate dioxygenase-like ring-hydroxylating dioxygenase large terminal subunit